MSAQPAPTDAPLIALENATFGYRHRPVVAGVTLAVRPGELVALVGPNGSGKTTLFRGMLGLLRPMAGRVVRRTRAVGYVPQREVLDELYPLSAREVVEMGSYGRLRGWRTVPQADRDLTLACLVRVGLGAHAAEPFAAMSGGQRQRVLLARALMTHPELVVLDEPTSGVDVLAAERVLDLLGRLAREEGLAVLLVSHQVEVLRARVDRAAWVSGGRVTTGSPDELLAPERLHRLFVDAPEEADG